VGACHEGRHLFVAGLHKQRLVTSRPQRNHDAVDAVTGVAEDPLDAPQFQSLDQEIANGARHYSPPSLLRGRWEGVGRAQSSGD
jgi:hypothetical protein